MSIAKQRHHLVGIAFLLCVPFGPAVADGTSFEDLLSTGGGQYAQGNEEAIIRHFFRDRRDGFFLDVGCWRPIDFSTTYYLEKHLGWKGIGVDAIANLRADWERDRPRSKFINHAISDKTGEKVTFYQAGPISTTDPDVLGHWESVLEQNLKGNKIEIETITLNALLEEQGVESIDFLSLDINGTEPKALAGFDIERYRPALVHVEAHKKNHEALLRYFAGHGYRRIDEYMKHDITNWYFTDNEATEPAQTDSTER